MNLNGMKLSLKIFLLKGKKTKQKQTTTTGIDQNTGESIVFVGSNPTSPFAFLTTFTQYLQVLFKYIWTECLTAF